jgi:small subunit ribosomal protein S16
MGRKKQPHYRVIVAESEYQRDGRFVESIGYYKPLTKPARLVLDLGRVDHWLGQGAQPSDTVRSLISKARAGGDATVALGEIERAPRAQAATAKAAARGERAPVERKRAEPKGQTVVPQDIADVTGGSSAQDATAAEAMAAASVNSADVDAPTSPASMIKSTAEAEGAVKSRRSAKTAGADGKES